MADILKLKITGQVQGVGFRPFIYRLAQQFNLTGWVQNRSGEVITIVRGDTISLDNFQLAIVNEHPPLASPFIELIRKLTDEEQIEIKKLKTFLIKSSTVSEQAQRHIPPDYFTCNDCLDELSEPQQRRYRYPFINCTQCGPRYTLIRDLPYDRPNTSLDNFPLCADCFSEYSDTLDRRFHAQPLACEVCGPELNFVLNGQDKSNNGLTNNENQLSKAVEILKQGGILGIKGVGGYHLVCDARNEQSVKRLRERKHRPDKPLAVMFYAPVGHELEQLNQYCQPTEIESNHLISPQRPIVLIKSKTDPNVGLAKSINSGLNEVGAMLAYSPLHYLLLHDFDSPIVATSGNLSGESVLTDSKQAEERLAPICDAFLHHNRPILRPADDSVIRIIQAKARLIRIGRGLAPLELNLNFQLEKPTLAVGGQMKNTIALAWDNRVVISPHIGELDSKRSTEVFKQVIDDLCQLYRVIPEQIVCDAHPDYYSSRYAKKYAQKHNIPLSQVQHHKAHANIVYADYLIKNNSSKQHSLSRNWLVFTWDGTGLGDDQSIWGGEAFFGKPNAWNRVCSIKPFRLQGGDKVAKQPWRSAASLLWQLQLNLPETWYQSQQTLSLSYEAWYKQLNTLSSSSMGRLFDAASTLLDLGETSSFEGQGPMMMEALISETKQSSPKPQSPEQQEKYNALPLYEKDKVLLADWSPLIALLMDTQQSKQTRAFSFHQIIAETLIQQAKQIRQQKGNIIVGLSGGVFQNKVLTELVLTRLAEENFNAYLPENVPYNDAGLALGQLLETSNFIETC